MNAQIEEMRQALLALRKRTGDNSFGHCVTEGGKIQLVKVTFNKSGRSKVVPVFPPQSAEMHLQTLQTYLLT